MSGGWAEKYFNSKVKNAELVTIKNKIGNK
jgi:hypothetical protein